MFGAVECLTCEHFREYGQLWSEPNPMCLLTGAETRMTWPGCIAWETITRRESLEDGLHAVRWPKIRDVPVDPKFL